VLGDGPVRFIDWLSATDKYFTFALVPLGETPKASRDAFRQYMQMFLGEEWGVDEFDRAVEWAVKDSDGDGYPDLIDMDPWNPNIY